MAGSSAVSLTRTHTVAGWGKAKKMANMKAGGQVIEHRQILDGSEACHVPVVPLKQGHAGDTKHTGRRISTSQPARRDSARGRTVTPAGRTRWQ